MCQILLIIIYTLCSIDDSFRVKTSYADDDGWGWRNITAYFGFDSLYIEKGQVNNVYMEIHCNVKTGMMFSCTSSASQLPQSSCFQNCEMYLWLLLFFISWSLVTFSENVIEQIKHLSGDWAIVCYCRYMYWTFVARIEGKQSSAYCITKSYSVFAIIIILLHFTNI